MLNKHHLPMVREQAERCDTLGYSWERLNSLAGEVSTHLLAIQPQFKADLVENVKDFITTCDNFYVSYDQVLFLVFCFTDRSKFMVVCQIFYSM